MTNKHDDALVERVAKAIFESDPFFDEMQWEYFHKKGVKDACRREAKAAVAAINLPAIRAQARKEALEEAAKVCAEYPYAMPMEEEIRNLIEKEG